MTQSSKITPPSTAPNGSSSAKSPVAPCNAKKGPWPAKWDMDCVRDILCCKDADVISRAKTTQTVYKADQVFFDDPYFDGTNWTTKRFNAAGTAGGGEIMMLSSQSCEQAAITLYHEVWHTKQPSGMGWPHPSEDDAYYNTELWTIEQGLPSQANPPLRTTDSNGKVVPDKALIKKHVDEEYPQPTSVSPEWRIVNFKKSPNQTNWRNRNTGATQWKKSVKGDSMAGPQQTVNKQQIPASAFKCP